MITDCDRSLTIMGNGSENHLPMARQTLASLCSVQSAIDPTVASSLALRDWSGAISANTT